VLSDNLFGLVTTDGMRSGVPSDDEAIRIEHDDSIVFDVVHQEVKNLITTAELILSELAGCYVADGAGLQDVRFGLKMAQEDRHRERSTVLAAGRFGEFGGSRKCIGHRAPSRILKKLQCSWPHSLKLISSLRHP
jgi:hypothetical protein